MSRRVPYKPGLSTRGGIITERDPEFCIVRLRLPAGMVTPGQLKGIGAIAERYGVANLHLTTRQTLELPHVDPARLDPLLRITDQNARQKDQKPAEHDLKNR